MFTSPLIGGSEPGGLVARGVGNSIYPLQQPGPRSIQKQREPPIGVHDLRNPRNAPPIRSLVDHAVDGIEVHATHHRQETLG